VNGGCLAAWLPGYPVMAVVMTLAPIKVQPPGTSCLAPPELERMPAQEKLVRFAFLTLRWLLEKWIPNAVSCVPRSLISTPHWFFGLLSGIFRFF